MKGESQSLQKNGHPDIRKRVRKIFREIEETTGESADTFVLANSVEPHLDISFFYVTGFPYGLFERSYVVAEKSTEKITVVTTALEKPIADTYADKDNMDLVFAKGDEDTLELLRPLAAKANENTRIGLNFSEITHKGFLDVKSAFKKGKFIDVSKGFENARLVKDDLEVELIQKACDIAANAYKKVPSVLENGVTESFVAAKIAYRMQKSGGGGISFDTIVGFGKNSAEPHYAAGEAKLKKSQFVLCDYGTKYKRYCSDITRTLVFGKASKEQKRIYEIVKAANELGISLCTSENRSDFVHSKVAAFIDSTEYKGRFIHSTGHSLGLAVHDGPGLSKKYKESLKPGMVLTVEPGIYVPELGGVRIEDDVLITKNGPPKVLTSRATKELIEV